MRHPNWEWATIGDIFDIGAGKTVSPASRAGERAIPFLRTSNVYWDRIDLSSIDYMSISDAELAEKRLIAGDLLVCEGGEIGRAAIWDGQIESIVFQNHLHRLRPKTGQIVPRFYVYFLQSAFTQLGLFEGAGNKTTIPNLSRSRLAAFDVPKPPLEEQKRIVQTLGAVRELVSLKNLEIEHLEELFDVLMFITMTGKPPAAANQPH
jgi:type I restriction enzyme S subunit